MTDGHFRQSPPAGTLGGCVTELGPSTLIMLAAGLLLQTILPTCTDVSWLLVAANRMLGGQELYVDILETNPPLSVLLYLPAVWVERNLGLPAEAVVVIQVSLAALASLVLTMRLMVPNGLAADAGVLRVLLGFTLLLYPMGTFAQREHIALIAALPMIAMAVVRSVDGRMAPWERELAGFGAGLAVAIKPHFILAVGLPYLFACWRRRSLRPLFGVEAWTAAAVFIAYVIGVMLLFPTYVSDMMPMLLDTYRPARDSIVEMMERPILGLYCATLLAAVGTLCAARGASRPRSVGFLAASVGFAAAYVEQGKGWPYHFYPALALATVVIVPLVLGGAPASPRVRAVWASLLAVTVPLVGLSTLWFASALPFAVLASEVRQVSPPSPKIAVVGADLAVGHPLTRMIGGQWVERVGAQWLARAAAVRRAENLDDPVLSQRMNDWIALDLAMLRDDLVANPPDVWIFDRRRSDWLAWTRQDPVLADMLSRYALATRLGKIEIWRPAESAR